MRREPYADAGTPDFTAESLRLALENERRAEANWSNLVPWRWRRFWRENRAIREGIRESRRRRDATYAARPDLRPPKAGS